MIFKKFNSFLNENENNNFFVLKNFLLVPFELEDIFHICYNEVQLSNNDLLILNYYTRIYFLCLMQYNDLTLGNVDIISDVRNSLVRSNDVREARFQFKTISNPKHLLPASMLRMLIDLKDIDFINKHLKKFDIISIISNFIKEMLTEESICPYTVNFKKMLFNSKFSIK